MKQKEVVVGLVQLVSDKIDLLRKYIFMFMYKRHLKRRIEKNNFGRREEW
jgi:hypothetical protein